MFFSKSFAYAVRGVLYIALKEETKKTQLDEISDKLNIPRHFLGKVMKMLVKNQILESTKGPYGGFSLLPDTLDIPLIKILELTDGMKQFNDCALCLRKCNARHPCPLHYAMMNTKSEMIKYLGEMTFGNMVSKQTPAFIKSITSL